MNIFAFCASNSSESINRRLLRECVSNLSDHEVTFRSVSDFELPIFSQDLEGEGKEYPDAARDFLSLVKDSDAIVIASPEHNSSIPAAFKNLIDWCSRSPAKPKTSIFMDKPVLLLSTSPGGRGGSTNLEHLSKIMPWWGADIRGNLSIASFYQRFDGETEQFDQETKELLKEKALEFVLGL